MKRINSFLFSTLFLTLLLVSGDVLAHEGEMHQEFSNLTDIHPGVVPGHPVRVEVECIRTPESGYKENPTNEYLFDPNMDMSQRQRVTVGSKFWYIHVNMDGRRFIAHATVTKIHNTHPSRSELDLTNWVHGEGWAERVWHTMDMTVRFENVKPGDRFNGRLIRNPTGIGLLGMQIQ